MALEVLSRTHLLSDLILLRLDYSWQSLGLSEKHKSLKNAWYRVRSMDLGVIKLWIIRALPPHCPQLSLWEDQKHPNGWVWTTAKKRRSRTQDAGKKKKARELWNVKSEGKMGSSFGGLTKGRGATQRKLPSLGLSIQVQLVTRGLSGIRSPFPLSLSLE